MYKGPEALKRASGDLRRPSGRRVPGGGDGNSGRGSLGEKAGDLGRGPRSRFIWEVGVELG